ncbi:MAG: N-acetylmuramoyl-L-alanine amidase [Synergistales bacterium]|nr:N-acetylmuramoyl-L-alanine amidase [Synergistales bacterium]
MLLLLFAVPMQAGEQWKLWRGEAFLGAVPVRMEDGVVLASLIPLAGLADCSVREEKETLWLGAEHHNLEFVAQGAVARLDGQIVPLQHPVVRADGDWWADVHHSLSLLNRLVEAKSAERFYWKGAQPQPSDASAESTQKEEDNGDPEDSAEYSKQFEALVAGLSKQDEGTRREPVSGTAVGGVALEGLRWSWRDNRIRAVLDISDTFTSSVQVDDDAVRVTIDGLTIDASCPGAESPYPGEVDVSLNQQGGADGGVVVFNYQRGRVKHYTLSDPHRLVVDFIGPRRSDEQPSDSDSPSLPRPSAVTEPDGRGEGPPLVVIDPGHGGKDPGAVANGILEKDLNLAVSRKLATLLKQLGLRVHLTRNSDTYLKLGERTDIANRMNADLFISIHGNALPPGKHAKGCEVYIMALPTDEDAMKLARIENREFNGSVKKNKTESTMLLRILGDMQQNAKVSDSMTFAEVLFSEGKKKGMPMRRIAQAPFAVLKGAGMPSVLVEVGFLTEKSEARRLATDSYRKKIAEFLARGVHSYLQ